VSRKPSRSSFVFSTTDVYGNIVTLDSERWLTHILGEHPQMWGCELAVRKTVEDPAEVRRSLNVNTSVAYVSEPNVGPRAEGIRVIVDYNDTSYEKGATSGMIITAYPVDIVIYGSPQIGKTIYKKRGSK
jgi:hypothetical protein